jgi:TetR/AcrR family transcriptional regulator, cholesterol catabolism regulator
MLPRATRDEVRSRLLALAATYFRRKGFEATTTRELATALGLKKASLYHYITDKPDLLADVCEAALSHIHASVEAALAAARHPWERVERMIQTHVTTMLADRDMHATMLIELRALTGDRRDHIVQLRDNYEALFRRVISDAQAEGLLRQDIPAHDLTLALLNLLNWTIFWYDPAGPLTPEQLADEFRRIFLFGATARSGEN